MSRVVDLVAGGTAQYLAAQFVAWAGSGMAPAYWVIGVCVVGLLTVSTIAETGRRPCRHDPHSG
ncbi:MAG: hypothetical protein ACK40Z_04005 [Dietzia sp.]